MRCPSCASDNPDGHRFCGQCGGALTARCRSCDAELSDGVRFCGQCGTAVDAAPAPAAAEPAVPDRRADAERRRVSVLFVDLVGFTTFSEQHDAEVVRDLQSDYFEQARTIVARYDGTIEKFVGDAVVAVWGTPVAREDDAERAVRAGLEMLDAVTALGEGSGREHLRGRAGVTTGQAAVRLGAVGQGMVAGDVVNTAARIEALADPGTLLVDDATREASSGAVSYAAAGEHELRGRSEPVRLFRAVQVVAGGGGAQRFDGLEAPFIGRDRDLRMVKELFHDSVEQSRARLVVVSGVAGVGKSRLGWEFFKYIDGISLMTSWHIGRCLSYGEGVAYWALAEMFRMRLRIAEGDSEATMVAKLDDGLRANVADPEERAWLRPRLGVLLGLGEVVDGAAGELEQESLFAGWRLFVQRLAEVDPVVMLFEDMQHADTGLLDFVDHLLEWGSDLPVFMLALARPELAELRPGWGGHHRSVTSLYLEPLGDGPVEEMVDALVHGLPPDTRRALAVRAEGIPLFAIETVRMLIDRDLVVPRGGVYVLAEDVGDVGALDVPPTLQALVAARLDNLPEEERRLVMDVSVLGLSFTPRAATAMAEAVGSMDPGRVEDLLASLARREVLTVRGDARSPEAGQFRFVQKVMRTVAYETLSRRDRKVRHLAAAEHLRATYEADDIAGIVATHVLSAAEAVPDDADAGELRAQAVHHLERAGDRARGLAAPEEALRYYERALDLVTGEGRARLAELAGTMARRCGSTERAMELLAQAHEAFEAAGALLDVARVASRRGDVLIELDRYDDALALMTSAHTAADSDRPHADLAQLANSIATAHFGHGDGERADPWLDRAIQAAEAAGAWEVLARALNVKGLRMYGRGRPVEGRGLMRAALDLATQHGLTYRAVIQSGNLALLAMYRDLDEAARLAADAAALAPRTGDRATEAFAVQVTALVHLQTGRWDRVDVGELRRLAGVVTPAIRTSLTLPMVALATWRGTPELLEGVELDVEQSFGDLQVAAATALTRALLAEASGDDQQALVEAHAAIELAGELGGETDELLLSMPTAIRAALRTGQTALASRILALVSDRPPGLVPALMHAQWRWLSAIVAAAEGEDDDVDVDLAAAERGLEEVGAGYWLARARMDHAEWLADRGHGGRAATLAEQARALFADIGAGGDEARARALVGASRDAVGVGE